jgi:ADP-ribose pyrophosphatase YjhB (NUDIX family)
VKLTDVCPARAATSLGLAPAAIHSATAVVDPRGGHGAGESIAETVVRELKEETGLDVEPTSIVGIYSNPRHVVEYADGEVRQQFSICFACRVVGGQLATSEESSEVGFLTPDEIRALPMHEPIRLRIPHYLERRGEPVIA